MLKLLQSAAGSLALLVALPATALALDIQTIEAQIYVDSEAGSNSAAELLLLVDGTGITDAFVTAPGASEYYLLEPIDPTGMNSSVWFADITFKSMADFQQAFPAGQYVFSFNAGNRTAVVDLVFNVPPAPNVSSPAANSKGSSLSDTQFAFDPCGSGCDDTVVLLFDGGERPAGQAVLAPSSSTWAPNAPLKPRAKLEFLVLNTTFSDQLGLMTTGGGDSFDVLTTAQNIETVGFASGGAFVDEAPQGDFGIAFSGSSHPLHDPSGAIALDVAGIDVRFDATLDSKGTLLATGAGADIDGNGSFETPIDVKGKVKAKGAVITIDWKMKAKTDTLSLSLGARDTINAATGMSRLDTRASGKIGETPLKAENSVTGPVPPALLNLLDWTLDVTVQTVGGKQILATGMLSFSGGSVPLAGKGSFKDTQGTASLSLRGTDAATKGASVRIRGFRANGPTIASAELGYKAFGHAGKAAVSNP